MNKTKWAVTSSILLLALLSFMYRLSHVHRMTLLNSSQAMRKEIVKRIPIGTDINQAQNIMQANGFECQKMRDEVFAEDYPIRGNQRLRGPADYLSCDRTASVGPFVSRRWQVAIVERQEKVSDVSVSIGLTGL